LHHRRDVVGDVDLAEIAAVLAEGVDDEGGRQQGLARAASTSDRSSWQPSM
jgi:hypothetical protein